MLQEIAITPSTIIIVALILVGAVFAVRRIVLRGLCDCGDGCDGCKGCSHTKGGHQCKACSVTGDMLKNIDKSLGANAEAAARGCDK